MSNDVQFAKLFSGSIAAKISETTETTVVRQLLLRRSFKLDSEGCEEIAIETTTLDNKQILLTVKSLPNQGAVLFDTFSEDAAKEVMQNFCTRTLEEINEAQDLDFDVTGVNYD